MTTPEDEPGEITIRYQFAAAGEEVSITVSGWFDPMVAISALRTAGSEDQLNQILEQLKAQAEQ